MKVGNKPKLQTGPDEQIAVQKVKMTDLSFAMETERYESLMQGINYLLAAESLLSVALVTVLPFAYEVLVGHRRMLFLFFLVITVLLASSFVCSLLSLWRVKYMALGALRPWLST